MGYQKPAREDAFVRDYLGDQIRALSKRPHDVQRLLQFARDEVGADPMKLTARLRMVFAGRAPTAFIAVLIERFYTEGRNWEIPMTLRDGVYYQCPEVDVSALATFVRRHPMAGRIRGISFRYGAITIAMHSPHLVNRAGHDSVDQEALAREVNHAGAPQVLKLRGELIRISYYGTAEGKFTAFDDVGFDVDGAIEMDPLAIICLDAIGTRIAWIADDDAETDQAGLLLDEIGDLSRQSVLDHAIKVTLALQRNPGSGPHLLYVDILRPALVKLHAEISLLERDVLKRYGALVGTNKSDKVGPSDMLHLRQIKAKAERVLRPLLAQNMKAVCSALRDIEALKDSD